MHCLRNARFCHSQLHRPIFNFFHLLLCSALQAARSSRVSCDDGPPLLPCSASKQDAQNTALNFKLRTYRFANGDYYAGEFKNMVRDGRGTYVGVDGGKYAGGWKQGRYHGLGTLLLPNGRGVQAGRWDENKFVGDPGTAGLTGGAM
jgi:hypothetical protein